MEQEIPKLNHAYDNTVLNRSHIQGIDQNYFYTFKKTAVRATSSQYFAIMLFFIEKRKFLGRSGAQC